MIGFIRSLIGGRRHQAYQACLTDTEIYLAARLLDDPSLETARKHLEACVECAFKAVDNSTQALLERANAKTKTGS